MGRRGALWLQVRAGGYVRVCVCVGVRRVALRCKTKLLGYRMCVCVCVCVWVGVGVCCRCYTGSRSEKHIEPLLAV